MAKVKEIQVCGGKITTTLTDTCLNYLQDLAQGTDRPKLNFTIELDCGVIKCITFRQTDDGIEVYGDFAGMPNTLEWARKVLGTPSPKEYKEKIKY